MRYQSIEYIERSTGQKLIEKIPGEKYLKFLYYNPLGRLTLWAIVKRKFFSSLYGYLMNSEKSKKKIQYFVENYKIDLENCEKKLENFISFNDFFCRKLKKLDITQNKNIFVSCASGKILAFEKINNFSKFYLKGQEFSLKKLFLNSELAQKYENGTFIIVRLAPVDYHRFHFPCDGKISKSILINGNYYSVSPLAIRTNPNLFFENKRELSFLESDIFGKVAIFEVGATMVGSITQTYISNTFVKKGDEKGYFSFGGSTCIMILPYNKIKIDEDILINSKKGLEVSINVGEQIGIATKN